MLQQARQSRVVQITITPPMDSFGDLERELEATYGLDEVVVVDTTGSAQGDIALRLGVAAA
ncbi:MAG: sugar-binding transcriptional regulator, partial [Caldilinea sp.]